MARLFHSGFESRSLVAGVEWDVIPTSGTIDTTNNRPGGSACFASAVIGSVACGVTKQFAAATGNGPFYLRFYLKSTNLGTANYVFAGFKTLGTGLAPNSLYLRANAGGNALQLMTAANAQIGSDSPAINDGVWHMIDLVFGDDGVGNTGTTCHSAYVDGVKFAGSNAVTAQAAPLAFSVGENLTALLNTIPVVSYFDDIAINDGTATLPTGLCGEGSIVHLKPSGDGDNHGFATQVGGTAGAANNFTRVDEVTPDDVTTYNASASLNVTDDYLVDAMPSNAGAISVVAVGVRFALSSVTSPAKFKVRCKKAAAGTVSSSVEIVPNSLTYRTNAIAAPFNFPLVMTADPDAGSWTVAELNTAQVGVIISTGGTGLVRVSTLWLSVEFQLTSTRTAPAKMALRSVANAETVPAAMQLSTSANTRTVPASMALQPTSTRTALASMELSTIANTRTAPANMALRVIGATRTVPASMELSIVNSTRTAPASMALQPTATRTAPANAALQPTATRTAPGNMALLATASITAPVNMTLSVIGSSRTVPASMALSVIGSTRTAPAKMTLSVIGATRTAPAKMALRPTFTRSAPANMALQPTSSRTVPAKMELQATFSRVALASVELETDASLRVAPSSIGLQINASVTAPASVALQATSSRSAPASMELDVANAAIAPASMALQVTSYEQAPASVALEVDGTEIIAPAFAALEITGDRTAPASMELSGGGTTTGTREAPASVGLRTTTSQQAPASVGLRETATSVVPTEVQLFTSGTKRIAPASMTLEVDSSQRTALASLALRVIANDRVAPASFCLRVTNAVSTSASMELLFVKQVVAPAKMALSVLGEQRSAPASMTLRTTDHQQTVPVSLCLRYTHSLAAPASVGIQPSIKRVAPASQQLSVAGITRSVPASMELFTLQTVIKTTVIQIVSTDKHSDISAADSANHSEIECIMPAVRAVMNSIPTTWSMVFDPTPPHRIDIARPGN